MRPLDVHFQLMQRLPVRTVLAKPPPDDRGGRPPAEATAELNIKIRELAAEGLKPFQIAERLGTARSTVGYHLNGKCATAAKAAQQGGK
jgi:hypothetical protein